MKTLILYPNTPLLNPPPISMGLFTALLRREGVEVDIFDTTFYLESLPSDEAKKESVQVRPYEYDYSQLPIATTSLQDGLRAHLRGAAKPDLILLSVLESTWNMGCELLDVVHEEIPEVPVVVGGVFPTAAPHLVLKHPAVDWVSMGEGEGATVDICRAVMSGSPIEDIPNVCSRSGDSIRRNPMRPVVDINSLPFPDYSAFHKARFLRPMAGRVYRTIPIETNRGCPYSCTFCNSPATVRQYRQDKAGHFFRKKNLDRIEKELHFLIKEWDAEYVYFTSDTFLCMNDEEFERFIEIYDKIRLPFWIQSRAETLNDYRAQRLKDVGCHRMSIGLEHGNTEFRKGLLKKHYSNEQMILAAASLSKAGIPLSVNNIIGFPDETRELVFDTIELNRQIQCDTTNAYAFIPFHGTPLHEYCVGKGLVKDDNVFGCVTIDTPLDMPQLSADEIKGLRKTFALYAKMPKEYWPRIERAEADDEEGRREFSELTKIYTELFFST